MINGRPLKYPMEGGTGRFFHIHSIEVVINCFGHGVIMLRVRFPAARNYQAGGIRGCSVIITRRGLLISVCVGVIESRPLPIGGGGHRFFRRPSWMKFFSAECPNDFFRFAPRPPPQMINDRPLRENVYIYGRPLKKIESLKLCCGDPKSGFMPQKW